MQRKLLMRMAYRMEAPDNGGVVSTAYWDAVDDDDTCSVCSYRSSDWNPWFGDVIPSEGTPRTVQDESERIAHDLVSKAAKAVPQVTEELLRLSQQLGGTIDGSFVKDGQEVRLLDFKLKTEGSTARKITVDSINSGNPPEALRDNLYDVLRYTIVADEAAYGRSVAAMSEQLVTSGYTPVRMKNFWKISDDGYAGINSVWRTSTGQLFELQFHTQRTIDTKEVFSHPLLEQQRLLDEGSAAYEKIDKEIADAWRELRDDPPKMSGIRKAEKVYP